MQGVGTLLDMKKNDKRRKLLRFNKLERGPHVAQSLSWRRRYCSLDEVSLNSREAPRWIGT